MISLITYKYMVFFIGGSVAYKGCGVNEQVNKVYMTGVIWYKNSLEFRILKGFIDDLRD